MALTTIRIFVCWNIARPRPPIGSKCQRWTFAQIRKSHNTRNGAVSCAAIAHKGSASVRQSGIACSDQVGREMTRKEALQLKKQFEQLTDKIQRELGLPKGPTLVSGWKKNMTIHQIQTKRLKLLVDVFYRTIDEALKK